MPGPPECGGDETAARRHRNPLRQTESPAGVLLRERGGGRVTREGTYVKENVTPCDNFRSASRRGPVEEALFLHLHVERDRVEIEAVRPGQDAIVEKDAGEKGRIAQRFNHLADFGGSQSKSMRKTCAPLAPIS